MLRTRISPASSSKQTSKQCVTAFTDHCRLHSIRHTHDFIRFISIASSKLSIIHVDQGFCSPWQAAKHQVAALLGLSPETSQAQGNSGGGCLSQKSMKTQTAATRCHYVSVVQLPVLTLIFCGNRCRAPFDLLEAEACLVADLECQNCLYADAPSIRL